MYADADAVKSRRAHFDKIIEICRRGIDLRAYLGVLADVIARLYALKHPAKQLRGKRSGRSAAEKDGVYHTSFGAGSIFLYFAQKRGYVSVHLLTVTPWERAKIAIAAFTFAKRDVNVDAKRTFFHIIDRRRA